jgi:hypothetical protein
MSEHDDEGFEDEFSDEALDAEIARRTKEMQTENASRYAEAGDDAGPVTLGIEGLSKAELDELILVRAGEVEPTSAKVKAVISANDAATPREHEEVPVAAGTFSSMSDADFSELVRNRPGIGGGW